MTEINQVYRTAKKHLQPLLLMLRCEHKYELGWADVHWIGLGASGWIENKLIPASGRCPDHFTLEQMIWGETIVSMPGGRWHLLGLRGDTWYLLTAQQARTWFDGGPLEGAVQQRGRFPTREILRELVK